MRWLVFENASYLLRCYQAYFNMLAMLCFGRCAYGCACLQVKNLTVKYFDGPGPSLACQFY